MEAERQAHEAGERTLTPPRQVSAPSLAHPLRGNLTGLEAAVASLASAEVGLKASVLSHGDPGSEGEGI